MSKVAHYLQEHLVGEVMTSADARRYFASDASIFTIAPSVIVYPKNENDVRKTARFSWQLAERGRIIPITARGSGTDVNGAAIGSGMMLVFPAHMNRILELDSKSGDVVVEPGINFGKLQQTLITHGHFVPSFPASMEYSTVGGAVANDSAGVKTVKYGSMANYVKSLRVVLANGEVIQTERLSKRELNKKLGLATFEGEVYRAVDTLLEENKDLVNASRLAVTKNNAGYNLTDIKNKDGSLDLTPLFVGSQGTLGIISEINLTSEGYNPETSLMMAKFTGLDGVQASINELRNLKELPSAIEIVNADLLNEVQELNPNYLKDIIAPPFPEFVLLVEFDSNDRTQKKQVKQAKRILNKFASEVEIETEPEHQQRLWKIRQTAATYMGHSDGHKHALSIIDDGAVPPERLNELIDGINELFKSSGFKSAPMWGHAGDGHLYVKPQLNLSQVGDRQTAFRLLTDYYKLVVKLGGTISAEHNDGRLKAPLLEMQYGSEIYALLHKVKKVFDPYGILNPGVKLGTSIDDLKNLISGDFSFSHLYDHLPSS
jgi:FAD/FMN-containing dehydrogenase